MRHAIAGLLLLAAAVPAQAAIKTQTVVYQHGNVTLEGYLAYDDAKPGPRPGILVVHEWLGINEGTRKRVEMLAELGYIAFALDMFGQGVRGQNANDGMRLTKPFKDDRDLMRARARAGLDVLSRHERVNPKQLAAIGYCFGGTTALELARGGTDLAGVVAFHAGLGTPKPATAGGVRGKILVCHGADDPFVPPAEVAAFEKEMRDAKVDWQLNAYGDAVHSFTSQAAGHDKSRGAAYNASADRRSWQAMQAFFAEIFGQS